MRNQGEGGAHPLEKTARTSENKISNLIMKYNMKEPKGCDSTSAHAHAKEPTKMHTITRKKLSGVGISQVNQTPLVLKPPPSTAKPPPKTRKKRITTPDKNQQPKITSLLTKKAEIIGEKANMNVKMKSEVKPQ